MNQIYKGLGQYLNLFILYISELYTLEKYKFLKTLNKYTDNTHSILAGSKRGLDKYIVKSFAD